MYSALGLLTASARGVAMVEVTIIIIIIIAIRSVSE